ncbi:12118_t:CDS:2, partial [Dentiscutata erythropus]
LFDDTSRKVLRANYPASAFRNPFTSNGGNATSSSDSNSYDIEQILRVRLNDNEAKQPPLDILLNFLIGSYSKATQISYIVDILRALSQVLYENGANCQN